MTAVQPLTLIPGIELKVPLLSPLLDPDEILDLVRVITAAEVEGFRSGLHPDMEEQAREVIRQCSVEGLTLRFYVWPDLACTWTAYDAPDDELVWRYAEARKRLELELSITQGEA